ncbi:Transposable element Tc3 transposase, partial [Harpegnathos saltator]
GRITCGMWDWIRAHGLGELVEVSPHMDTLEYVDILENVLLPNVRRIYAEEDMPPIRLVQDNSVVHISRIVQEWFAQHPELKFLNWPVKSPGPNLIENVWAKIVNSWDPSHEGTRAALIAHARNAWEDLRWEPQFFWNLHNSIDARLQQVVARQE